MNLKELHKKSTKYMQDAIAISGFGHELASLYLYELAFEYEKLATESISVNYQQEPTRSILFRSAANLALSCYKYQEASKIAQLGLLGYPSEDIKQELKKVLILTNKPPIFTFRNLSTEEINFKISVSLVNTTQEFLNICQNIEYLISTNSSGVAYLLQNDKYKVYFDNKTFNYSTSITNQEILFSELDKISPFLFFDKIHNMRYENQRIPYLEDKIKDNKHYHDDYFVIHSKQIHLNTNTIVINGYLIKNSVQNDKNTFNLKHDNNIFILEGRLIEANAENNTIKVVDINNNYFILNIKQKLADIVSNYWYQFVSIQALKATDDKYDLISIDQI